MNRAKILTREKYKQIKEKDRYCIFLRSKRTRKKQEVKG